MKRILLRSTLSEIQLAKAIKALKTIPETQAESDQLVDKFVPLALKARTEQIIAGFEQEDEFAILCRLMGTCTSLVRLDQTPLIEDDSRKAPDFLASFQPGCWVNGKTAISVGLTYKAFIEVKSVAGDVFKISKKDFARRCAFAEHFSLPLLFAVRFKKFIDGAWWGLIDSDQLACQNYKLTITQVFATLRPVLFDEYFLMPIPNLHALHWFSKKKKGLGIKHSELGTEFKLTLAFGNEQVEVPTELLAAVSVILDAFGPKEVKIERRGDVGIQILSFGISTRSIADILYSINRITTDERGSRIYDPSRISSRFDSITGKPILLDRKLLDYVSDFRANTTPLFFKASIGPVEEHWQRLLSLKQS